MRKIVFLIALFSLSSIWSTAQINWPVFMAKQSLKWDNLGTDYYSGIILGNGLLGTNIYKEGDSLIRFDIGRSDVVDHREKLFPQAGNLYTKPRLPIGCFKIKTAGKITGAKIELDIYNAEARGKIFTTLGELTLLAFVVAEQNVISITVNGTGDETGSELKWNPGRSISPRYLQGYPTDKPLNFPDNPPVKLKYENGYSYCNQPLLNRGGYSTVYKSTRGKLIVSVGYDADGTTDESKEALNSLKKFEGNPASLIGHRNWWHNYYQQSFISLPDKRMENFYWIQLYKLASITRANKPIADLMGPWTSATPWPAIWWNLNTQLTYSPIFTANHLELGESLFKSLNQNQQNLIHNVPEKWRSDAAAIGRSSSYDLISPITENEIAKGTFEPANLTWQLYYYYQYYTYTKDEQTLKTKIYPLLKKATNFLIHLLKKDEQGVYHFPLSHSPEYKNVEDSNYTLATLNWALTTLIKINKEQQLNDRDADKWGSILKNLVPFPVGDTGFLIGKDVPLNSSHRHYSHLLMIYPYQLVNWEQSENRALISLSLKNWLSQKSALAGYSFTGGASIYASMGDGDKAYQWLNELLDRFMQPNTLYKESGPVIETPLAAATSIQEMLIQSWGEKIRIFPAMPTTWDNVSFKQLRTEGAFLVSADRRNKQTKYIKIISLKGGKLTVLSNLNKFSIRSNKRTKVDYLQSIEDEKTRIDIKTTLPGESMEIIANDVDEKRITAVEYSFFKNWWWGVNENDAFKVITSRIQLDLQTDVNDKALQAKLTKELTNLNSDGSWADINYADAQYDPLKRIQNMATAYIRPTNGLYMNTTLYTSIVNALQNWLDRNPKNKNWWYNDIFYPQAIGQTLILMCNAKTPLPKDLEQSLIKRMMIKRFRTGDGANTSDEALHYLYRACLTQNKNTLDSAAKYLFEPVSITDGKEGLQVDGSYYQHGKQQAIASYGRVFISNSINAAYYLRDTEYALPKPQLNMLVDFLKNTFLKTIRNSFYDFNVRGRGISRKDSLVGNVSRMVEKIKLIDPENTTFKAEPFHKQYWKSSYTLHLRPKYTFSVQTVSNRTLRTERGNNENILGKFLSDGATNIQRRGAEYANLMPVWEWDKIPGTTSRDYPDDNGVTIQKDWGIRGTTKFVGGVSDGVYGVSTYDLNYDSIQAKKAWFFFDKEIVCLGAGIQSATVENVTTTLNQVRAHGNFASSLHLTGNQEIWAVQDSIGYIFPQGGEVKISNQLQKGNWYSINHFQRQDEVSDTVFKIWLDHGAKPKDATYEYIVIPAIGEAELKKYNRSTLQIIANTSSIQAVKHNELKILQVVFHKAGTLVKDGFSIEVDHPCTLQIKDFNTSNPVLYIADPAQEIPVIQVKLKLPAMKREKSITCKLPSGAQAGSTTHFKIID